jgi:Xaa-Pro aminopeptidase
MSRTFLCGTDRPTAEQKRLYRLAWEEIQHNTALLRAGLTVSELAERAFAIPEKCLPNRYSVVLHGVGMCDEYPHAAYAKDMETSGYDARLEAGMTVCVESYMGEVGGAEGVKLEQQVLITETGTELLSDFPFEDSLMPRQI